MSFFETAETCKLQEYESKRDSRLNIVSSSVGSLIIMMIKLDGVSYEAVKVPARINSVATSSDNPTNVDLSIIDRNLNPISQHEFMTQNDFIYVQGILRVAINGTDCRTTECYARDYFEEMLPADLVLTTAFQLSA